MENTEILRIILWGLGLCASGFLFLSGWIYKVSKDVESKKDDLEKKLELIHIDFLELKSQIHSEFGHGNIEGKLTKSINILHQDVNKLMSFIVGTMDKKGFISEVNDLQRRMSIIENKLWTNISKFNKDEDKKNND